MRQRFIFLFTISVITLMTGCQENPTKITKQISCSVPRPEVCTREYKPVCGLDSVNVSKTYSNACTACSDENVVEYTKAKCSD